MQLTQWVHHLHIHSLHIHIKQYMQCIHTRQFNGPFFRDYQGEPVPERLNQSGFY